MKYNIFGYLIGEGLGNVFKNKKSTIASLMIMCATMLIFGIFWILGQNINHFMDSLKEEQGIEVFMEKGATQEETDALEKKLIELNEFSEINYVSEDEAFKKMQDRWKDNPAALAGYTEENHIFPSSFILKFKDLSKSSEIENTLAEYEEIDNITSADTVRENLMGLAKGIKVVTGIKLTVYARRREISIMKYVGATNNFIRWPFIVEGMIIGLLANIISITLLGIVYNISLQQIVNSEFMQIINMELLTFQGVFSGIIIVVYMLLGIGIGVIGSIISMRKYLKV